MGCYFEHHESGDEGNVADLDDYLIIRDMEKVYLHLERVQQKLETDLELCPNYDMLVHTDDPLRPDMSAGGMRNRIYELIVCQESSIAAQIYYIVTVLMIMVSLVSLVFEEEYKSHIWEDMELVITVFFTLEYFVTLAVVSNRRSFLLDPTSMADIVAVLPYYIEQIVGSHTEILLVRLLRIARLNRIRQSPNPYVILIGSTLKGVFRLLSGIFAWLAIGSLIIGTFVHVLEGETFDSIPIGMWFGLVTLTTVGYGDISPETTVGYLVGSVAIIFGLCLCSIVLQAVGQIYNDEIDMLKDQLSEIKEALLKENLLMVKNGDDLHISPNVYFDDMIQCCLANDTCYPQINGLLVGAYDASNSYPPSFKGPKNGSDHRKESEMADLNNTMAETVSE